MPLPEDPQSFDLGDKAKGDVGALLGRTALTQGLRIARTLFILPLIAPAALGVYSYITVILGYLVQLHLGVFNVYRLRYPVLDAAGSIRAAGDLRRLAWQTSIAGSLVAFAVLVVMLARLGPWSWPIILLLAAAGATSLWAKHIADTYFVTCQFREQARIDGTIAILGFILAFVGAVTLGLTGLLAATVLAPAMKIFLARNARMPGIKWPLEVALLRRTFTTGVRLWWSSFVSSIRIGLDIIILKHVLKSSTQFGLYTFASVIAMTISALNTATVRVQAVHLTRMAGKAGDVRAPSVRNQMERSVVRDYLSALSIASAGALVLALLLPLLAPSYKAALPIAGPLLAAGSIQQLIKHPRKLLLIADRTSLANLGAYASLFMTVGYIAFVYFLLHGGIIAYAECSAVSYLTGAAVTFVVMTRALRYGTAGYWFLLKIALATTPVAAFNLSWLVPVPALGLGGGGCLALLSGLILFRFLFPGAIRDTASLLFGTLVSRVRR